MFLHRSHIYQDPDQPVMAGFFRFNHALGPLRD